MIKIKKIILFVATEKGYRTLNTIIDYDKDIIGFVCSFCEDNVEHSFHSDIKELCAKNDIPFYMWNDISNNLEEMIIQKEYDCAFAIGWRYFLRVNLFNRLKYSLIIYHDSLLPRYRGFAPVPTALINGEHEIGVTMFFASDEIDAGDIILQKKIIVNNDAYVNEVIEKIGDLYCEMTIELFKIIENNNDIPKLRQDSKSATYSAWRNVEDCQIDWSLHSREVYNLIRAVSKPYPGAFTFMEDKKIIIWKAELIDDLNFEKRYPGKIWKLDNGYPIVICGKGMIKLLEIEHERVSIIPFKKMRVNFVMK